jgi:predicted DNA-binding transcriptional regulator AlpA
MSGEKSTDVLRPSIAVALQPIVPQSGLLTRERRVGLSSKEDPDMKRELTKIVPWLDDPLLVEKEVAQMVRCSTSCLQKHRWSGTGPEFIRMGRSIRYRLSAVQRWLEEPRGRS